MAGKDKEIQISLNNEPQISYFCVIICFMSKLRISAVSYLNTFPFVFGLKESGILKDFSLSLEVPSLCAERLKKGEVDIALVPVGALPEIGSFHYIPGYCIGAVGEVKTVLLLSKVPLDRITRISLDFDSRTSVELVKVLARRYWHIDPQWQKLQEDQLAVEHDLESLVAIGDKTFALRQSYPYIYDLASEWIRFTGLPFVFAAWVSCEKLAEEDIIPFTAALAYGVNHKRESLEYFKERLPACNDCLGYLEDNISYHFDAEKKQGLDLFLSYLG